MLLDSLVNFVQPGSNLTLVTATGGSFRSSIYDILGVGAGVAPPNIIGNTLTFGSDVGIGQEKPQVQVNIGTAATTADAATLNIQFQGAQDTGAAGGYLPGTWQTFVETGPLTAAQLTAGKKCARFDFPPAFPDNFNPRYLSLNFQVAAATVFTGGTIAAAIVTMTRDDLSNLFQVRNFSV